MANNKNINDAPIVSPEGVKFLVLKNGKIAHCDISSTIKKAEDFKQSVIDDAVASAIQCVEKLSTKVYQLEKKIEELNEALNSMVVEAVATAEAPVEAKPAKSTKKSKKDAE